MPPHLGEGVCGDRAFQRHLAMMPLPPYLARLLMATLWICVALGFLLPVWSGFGSLTTAFNYAARVLVLLAIASAIGANNSPRQQTFWGYLLVSTLLDVAAATIWFYYYPDMGLAGGVLPDANTPVVVPFADLLQLGSYGILIFALWNARAPSVDISDWRLTSLDVATSVFAFSAVIWVWAVRAAGTGVGPWGPLVLDTTYLFLNIAILVALVRFRGQPSQDMSSTLVIGISCTAVLYFMADVSAAAGFYTTEFTALFFSHASGVLLGIALAVLGFTALAESGEGVIPRPTQEWRRAPVSWVSSLGVAGLSFTAMSSVVLGISEGRDAQQFNFIVIGSLSVSGLMLLMRQVISSRVSRQVLESQVTRRTEELAQARDQLSAANKSLSSLLQNAPLAIAVRDPNGAMVFGNPQWQVLAEQCIGIDQQVPDASEPGALRELTVASVTGETRRFLLVFADYLDDKGDAEGNWVILTDITELRDREHQMQTMTRLASLGEMATGLAHEINQPLQGLRLTLANIARQLSSAEHDQGTVPEKLERMSELINRASALVIRMRSYGRAPDHEREAFDLVQSIRTVIGLVGDQLNLQQVELFAELPGFAAWSFGHHMEFEQVLINLINNAADAILEQASTGAITITLGEHSDHWTLEVVDTGPGFPGDLMERLMEPFFTTKPVGKGTGLGLSISHGIIREMGGSVLLDNLTQGARVTLTLPKSSPT